MKLNKGIEFLRKLKEVESIIRREEDSGVNYYVTFINDIPDWSFNENDYSISNELIISINNYIEFHTN